MKLLVCGSRGNFKQYREKVFCAIEAMCLLHKDAIPIIIEGCCRNSADQYAEMFAQERGLQVMHFPGSRGIYFNRNAEMVKECDAVIAFWDGQSRGTANTVTCAVMNDKPVVVVELRGD